MQEKNLTVGEIAQLVDGKVIGDANVGIQRVSSLENATSGDISFLSNQKFEEQLNTTQASCVLLSNASSINVNSTCILCKDPYLAFALVAQALDTTPLPAPNLSEYANVHSSAVIGTNVTLGPGVVIQQECRIGNNVSIGANSFIGEFSYIGDNTKIYANVSIYHGVNIGESCILHAGVVVGSDGFGYARDGDVWVKIPQTGGVRIKNYVEIGANSCVDRGALNDTIIGNGVKIDNLCHVAHNVDFGENSAMAALSGVAGSTKVGKSCTFSGRSSVIGHLDIADGTHLTVGTVLNKSIKVGGVYSSGTGLQENKRWRKNVARFKQLDAMAKTIRGIEKELCALKSENNL